MRNSKEKRINRFFYAVISVYIFIAVFAPFIANEKPIYISIQGQKFFPALSGNPYLELKDKSGNVEKIRVNSIDWKNIEHDIALFAPICWSPNHSDLQNIYSSPFANQKLLRNGTEIKMPFRFRHFLGTGKTGNDVMAGLIHGTRTSISIGLFSMTIALLIGFLLGGMAGYFGDYKFKLKRGSVIFSVILIIPAFFYAFYLRSEIQNEAFSDSFLKGIIQVFFSLAIFLAIIIFPAFLKFPGMSFLEKKIFLPVDSIISRFIEIFMSLPRLILILTMAAISHPSVLSIILIIGFTSWTEIARIMRAQILQLREMNYIHAATAAGSNAGGILIRHLLPNVLSQMIVIWTLGIASAILVETGLSFLGIGVPPGTATWGSLMYEARENYQAWWLVFFTGGAIFLLLSTLYFIGNKYKKIRHKIDVLS